MITSQDHPADNHSFVPQKMFALAFAILIFALLSYRITIGIDLSDESYYISFIDGWLKTGLRASTLIPIHQTAEVLVYPFAKLFVLINGSVDGLALFLRCLYLFISCIAGLCFYAFARTAYGPIISAFAGIFIITFIPFSLPAPSYNTVGMLAMISALSAFGTYLYKRSSFWAFVSALAWMVAVIAYPSLLAVFIASLLLSAALLRPHSQFGIKRYIVLCLTLQAFGLLMLLAIYGLEHFFAIITATNAFLQVSDGAFAKITRSIGFITKSPGFMLLSAASMASGIFWARLCGIGKFNWLLVAAISTILACSYAIGPILYAQAHDYIFLLGLAAATFFVTSLITGKRNFDLVMTLMAGLGLFAGIVITCTATNGLVNFAVGGFFAIAIFLLAAIPPNKYANPISHIAVFVVASAFLLYCSFTFFYGDTVKLLSGEKERVKHGVFSGILTTQKNADAIHKTSQFLSQVQGDSIAILGRLPGIYLLTPIKPKTLSTWNFSQINNGLPKVEKLVDQFYSAAENQPSILVDVKDPWTSPPPASEQKLLSGYRPDSELKLDAWEIKVYRR